MRGNGPELDRCQRQPVGLVDAGQREGVVRRGCDTRDHACLARSAFEDGEECSCRFGLRRESGRVPGFYSEPEAPLLDCDNFLEIATKKKEAEFGERLFCP